VPTRKGEIIIHASPSDVFAEIPGQWISRMEQVTPGPIGVGTRLAERQPKVMYWEVTTYKPPAIFEMSVVGKREEEKIGNRFKYTINVTPDVAGSRVNITAGMTYTIFQVVFKMGLFAPFIYAFVYAALRRIPMSDILTGLKEMSEQGN
jgi:hypothetical protein